MTDEGLPLGTVLSDRFVLTDLLGKGGSGFVYRARQAAVERDVAIKVLTSSSLADVETRKRFMREARIVANLRCPYTVKLFDLGILEDGGLYIAMELVEGVTVERLLKVRGSVPLDMAAVWLSHIGESLREAHEAGIVHRDLKPANIMIEPGRPGRARLLDFGIAKAAQERQRITALGDIFGTPAYMAPESWSNDFGEVGPRTDIYAIGVLMVELLTGRLPFDARTPARLMRAHLYETPRVPGALLRDLYADEDVDRIALRCLAKCPTDRFASATEPADALRRLLSPDAHPAEVAFPERPRRRSAGGALATALGILALGIVGTTAVGGRLVAPDPASPAPSPSQTASAVTPSSSGTLEAQTESRDRSFPPVAERAAERAGVAEPRPPKTPSRPPVRQRTAAGLETTAIVGRLRPRDLRGIEARVEPLIRRCRPSSGRVIRVFISRMGQVRAVWAQGLDDRFERCVR